MEANKVKMKNSLRKLTGSLKTNMPISTVPKAPIPVHIAYAVPIGSVCTALDNNHILIAADKIKPKIHK